MEIEATRHGTVMVLKPQGALVEEELDSLHRAVDQQINAGSSRIVLDLADVPFVDSLGLEALLDIAEKTEEAGGGLRFACAPDITRDILAATRLVQRIELLDEIDMARKSFL